CKDSSECAESACPCSDGTIGFYASACINGKCDSSGACGCVAQQYTKAFGGMACNSKPPAPPAPPASAGTCSREAAATRASPPGGPAAGGSCSDASQCAEVRCPCANGTSYFAAACTNGSCDAAGACGCVANEYQASFHKNVCDNQPQQQPPPPPPAATCDGK